MSTRAAKIAELAPWFHNIRLPCGAETAPGHELGDFPRRKWNLIAPHLPEDLRGWRVLDVGCNAGFYSVELARRGASVLGIDSDPHYLAQARWVIGEFGLAERIELRRMQVYELARIEERFDLVLFLGVLYHLRYPLLALDILAARVKRLMTVQTMLLPGEELADTTRDFELEDRGALREPGWPKMAFIEGRFAGDLTNWWVPDRAGLEAMLRSAGLDVQQRPQREIYLCTPSDAPRGEYLAAAIQQEMRAATGQSPLQSDEEE